MQYFSLLYDYPPINFFIEQHRPNFMVDISKAEVDGAKGEVILIIQSTSFSNCTGLQFGLDSKTIRKGYYKINLVEFEDE